MKHSKTILLKVAALFVALGLVWLAAAAPAAERVNYGELWPSMSPAEKELLLIGYAKGLKSAEWTMHEAISSEAMGPEPRDRLLAQANSLTTGMENSEQLRAVIDCLDGFYIESPNRFIDWTKLIGLARAKLRGAPDDQIEKGLARLRKSTGASPENRKP